MDDPTPPPPEPGTDRNSRESLFRWVYENNQWGRSPTGDRYWSDSPTELTSPYREFLASFVRTHPDIRRVVDLACGDHKLTRETSLSDVHYVGVDIYNELIADNQRRFADERHEFIVRDLVEDPLPEGDLGILSMALYLMSFHDVGAILPKLRQYPYVLVTDGQPNIPPERRRNIDKPTGRRPPRDLFGNGFYLELEPFCIDLEVVHQYTLPSGELIRTVLLRNPPPSVSRP